MKGIYNAQACSIRRFDEHIKMILIAIGANLPNSDGMPAIETCRQAVARLGELPGLTLEACSRWYLTAPMPPSGQPDYVNGVARLSGEIDPELLLAWLQEIEARNGRVRTVPNAPRTLDLDIIDMDGVVRSAPDPILPHPRAAERAFVLTPLRDVCPDWIDPVRGKTVDDLLDALPPQGIRPADSD
ncbi:2-amino-4-hydroxy-6-hydroxymethyldihydropteridine pyrophosphokinase [Granulibacter bethesdensis]|nr:2-amino-4-hydroxy-6-hydroxymethyldihydropteridine pyrophosphokinase [Granulibacter bethesdensis]